MSWAVLKFSENAFVLADLGLPKEFCSCIHLWGPCLVFKQGGGGLFGTRGFLGPGSKINWDFPVQMPTLSCYSSDTQRLKSTPGGYFIAWED